MNLKKTYWFPQTAPLLSRNFSFQALEEGMFVRAIGKDMTKHAWYFSCLVFILQTTMLTFILRWEVHST